MSREDVRVARATAAPDEVGSDEVPPFAVLDVALPPSLAVLGASKGCTALFHATRPMLGRPLAELLDVVGGREAVERLASRAVQRGSVRTTLRRRRPNALGATLTVTMSAVDGGGGARSPEETWLAVQIAPEAASDDLAARVAHLESECEALRDEFQQFAYAASHDLQEPVRMITSYLQLFEKRHGAELPPEAREFFAFATDAAARLRAMLEGLLAFSRVSTQAGPIRPMQSTEALTRARNLLAEPIQATSARITHGPLPPVNADKQQLALLFRLLIANAIEFRSAVAPRIHVEAREEDETVTFAVRDNGIGIGREHHEAVFNAFEHLHARTEHPGIGMGLAIARRIVTRHGGQIWVDSETGQGASFRFTLPAVRPDREAAGARGG